MSSWFVLRIFSNHLKLLGPLGLDALKTELSTGKICFSDFVYQPSDRRKWIRIFEVAELLSALPEQPDAREFLQFEKQIAALSKTLPAAAPSPAPQQEEEETSILSRHEEKLFSEQFKSDWCLQSEGTEYGPFSFSEVGQILKADEFQGSVLLYHDELNNWLKVSNYADFLQTLKTSIEELDQLVVEKGMNTRTSRRRTVVASVSIRLKHATAVGICWDISEGGLQAYRLDAELMTGMTYTVVVIPAVSTGVTPFTVHAKLLWQNENTKRMGFQFTDPMEIQTVAMNLNRAKNNISKF